MTRMIFAFLLTLVLGFAPAAHAQTEVLTAPPMPAPIKALADEGAQVQYLGRHNGLDGWITIKSGQEQYFYVTSDGRSVVMGLLFDNDGKLVTVEQVRALQQRTGGALDALTQDKAAAATAATPASADPQAAFKTPSEQLYDAVSAANWVALGKPDAPVLYVFIDPQCPYCHDFLLDLKDQYIVNGLIQVRVIPVGLISEETKAQAAFLLAAPDGQDVLFRHLAGDKTALPATPGINTQGVERNIAIMQAWKFNVTPLSIYRASDGSVKIVQGRAKDIPALIADLVSPPRP